MIKKKYVEFETVLSNICTSNGSSVIFFSDIILQILNINSRMII